MLNFMIWFPFDSPYSTHLCLSSYCLPPPPNCKCFSPWRFLILQIFSHHQTPSVFPFPSQLISINEVSLVIKVSPHFSSFFNPANLISVTWLILGTSRWLEIQLYLGSGLGTMRVGKWWQKRNGRRFLFSLILLHRFEFSSHFQI